MPTYSIEQYKAPLFSTDVREYFLIDLSPTEFEVTAEMLRLVPPGTRGLRILSRYRPIGQKRVIITGEIPDVEVLLLNCASGGLETDDIFAKCRSLQYVWISKHDEALFQNMKYLPNLPLKHMGFNGFGLASNWSPEFSALLKSKNVKTSQIC
jgi:hypothetical protein